MYRPNRIGQYPIVDVDKTLVTNSLAVLDTVDHAGNTFGYLASNITVAEEINSDNTIFTGNATLLASFGFGYGLQVNGDDTERNYTYGISACLQYRAQSSEEFNVNLILARVGVGASPSLTANCVVTNPVFLPIKNFNSTAPSKPTITWSCDTAVLHHSEVSPPTVQEPIALFWHIENKDGSDQSMLNMKIRVSLHRYTQDLMSHDPTR